MVLLARTSDDGLSVFLVDMRDRGDSLQIKPIKTLMNHATTEVFFDDLELPADALIGEEGQGFRYILDGMNAERILIGSRVHRRRALVRRPRPPRTRPSARCSAGRSAPTRACSSRSRAPTWRSRPPT